MATFVGTMEQSNGKAAPGNAPRFAWSWIHIFQVIGAIFLTLGGLDGKRQQTWF